MLAEAQSQGILLESMEKEKERLKLKRSRILKQHREGYIDDDEFHGEIAAVELALHQLQTPEVNGVKFGDVIQAGEHIPGMAALWDEATPDERRDMVMLLLEPGGLYYDLELKIIAALKPRPAFLPILRMLSGIVEYDEARGLIVTENWQERNRRESDYLQLYQWDTLWVSFTCKPRKNETLIQLVCVAFFVTARKWGKITFVLTFLDSSETGQAHLPIDIHMRLIFPVSLIG